MLSCIGFHTFQMFIMLPPEEANEILGDFIRYCKSSTNLKIYPTRKLKIITVNDPPIATVWKTRCLTKDLGVKWTFRFFTPAPCHKNCMIEAKINPQNLIGNDDYVAICNESHLPAIKNAYNSLIKMVSANLLPFEAYLLNRVDYCANFDLLEMVYNCTVKQKMKLLKQGFIPYHYKEPKVDDPISKRKCKYKNSFYLESDSVTINIYGKQKQLIEESPNRVDDIERARNLVRFEIQCGSQKMSHFRREINNSMNWWELSNYAVTKHLLSDEFAKAIIESYFKRILMNGDYYTFENAKAKIESLGFRQQRRDRLLYVLELIKEHGGVNEAKLYLESVSGNVEMLIETAKELVEYGINPVTTPRRVGDIPNLMKAYEEMMDILNIKITV